MTNESEMNRLRHKILTMLTFEERMFIQPLLDKCLMFATKEPIPQSEWIPVSERLPEDETEVLIQIGQSMTVGYHKFDHTIYPPEFKDENETGWYDSKDDFIGCSFEVTAWMPLPEPYKEAENEQR